MSTSVTYGIECKSADNGEWVSHIESSESTTIRDAQRELQFAARFHPEEKEVCPDDEMFKRLAGTVARIDAFLSSPPAPFPLLTAQNVADTMTQATGTRYVVNTAMEDAAERLNRWVARARELSALEVAGAKLRWDGDRLVFGRLVVGSVVQSLDGSQWNAWWLSRTLEDAVDQRFSCEATEAEARARVESRARALLGTLEGERSDSDGGQAEEVERLRKIISACASAIGNGSCCSPTASLGFMELLPIEIAGVMKAQRQTEADRIASAVRADRERAEQFRMTLWRISERLGVNHNEAATDDELCANTLGAANLTADTLEDMEQETKAGATKATKPLDDQAIREDERERIAAQLTAEAERLQTAIDRGAERRPVIAAGKIALKRQAAILRGAWPARHVPNDSCPAEDQHECTDCGARCCDCEAPDHKCPDAPATVSGGEREPELLTSPGAATAFMEGMKGQACCNFAHETADCRCGFLPRYHDADHPHGIHTKVAQHICPGYRPKPASACICDQHERLIGGRVNGGNITGSRWTCPQHGERSAGEPKPVSAPLTLERIDALWPGGRVARDSRNEYRRWSFGDRRVDRNVVGAWHRWCVGNTHSMEPVTVTTEQHIAEQHAWLNGTDSTPKRETGDLDDPPGERQRTWSEAELRTLIDARLREVAETIGYSPAMAQEALTPQNVGNALDAMKESA